MFLIMENIKFLHTADLHLGSALINLSDPLKAKVRRRELIDTFKRMADYAQINGVNGFIVAGDLFDSGAVSPLLKKEVADIISSASSVVFFLLGGNHDSKSFDDDFVSMLPQNAVMLQHGKTCAFSEVNVTGYFVDEVFCVEEIPVFDEEKFNIVVLHGQTTSGNAGQINIKKLQGKNIDYLALGHIHSFSKGNIDKRGIYAYSGCPEGRGFDECGEKGFVLFDTQGGVAFKPYARRTCREIKIDVSGCDGYVSRLNRISKEIAAFPADDMFKVVLTGETQNAASDLSMLRDKLSERLFFVKIEDNTKLKIDRERLRKEMSLKGEFFRTVERLKASPEEKEKILRLGLKAMSGEEADCD